MTMDSFSNRYDKIVDDDHAYCIDEHGEKWVKLNGTFETTCLRHFLVYVMTHDPDFKGQLPSQMLYEIGVDDSRGYQYDQDYLDGYMGPY